MKRILSIICLLLFMVIGLKAKEFNKEQMTLRLELVKFLSSEGFQPKIDEDGDIIFKYNDLKHYLIINADWNNPFIVTLYISFSYDNDQYTKKNLENCITTVAQHKVVKLYLREKSFEYRSDIFCKNVDVVKMAFYPMLKQIEAARKDVATTLAAGLGGIDITNNKDAVFDKAIEYYRNEEYNMSFPLFKYLAESGFDKAYGYLGLAYELGEGVSQDESLMKRYYDKAMENGFYWCAYRLGYYYYSIKNYGDAMNNFIKCGANENPFRSDALFLAGKMYENGEGTERSITQAVLCYKKSLQYATQLECDARLALMRMGETIEREDEFVDATKTMLMGLTPKDMYKTGLEYELGMNGRNVSLTKAYAFYKAAADKGYTKAISKMGEIYISKFYPFNDKTKSDRYYSKAINKYKKDVKSDGNACYELGNMYHNGYGIEKNLEQAKYYYKSGALLGDINAAWRIGLIYKDEMEYAEAFKFLLKSADGGQGMAMYELAKLYENGLGTSYNKDKAIEWYQKCAESSYKASSDARKALKRLGSNEEKE